MLRSKHLARILHHKETEKKSKTIEEKNFLLEAAKGIFNLKVSLPKKGFAINVLEQPAFKRTNPLQEGNKGFRKIPLDLIYFASYQNLLLASFADFLESKKEITFTS